MTTIEELDAEVTQLQQAVSALQQNVLTLQQTTLTLEDGSLNSVRVNSLPDGNGVPQTRIPWSHADTLFIAPYPLTVLSVSVSFEGWSLPANDTSYWGCQVKRWVNNTGTVMADRTTQINGALANGGITSRTAWVFDSAPWADVPLSTNDLLLLRWYPVGSPASQMLPCTYTFRVQPL